MLDQEVKEKSKEIFTDSYTMSVGEIASMYKDDELELQPDYQRFFRWSNAQKTTFIESILLGIPIPPIFVYQKEDGIWAVIDGLQRLSTIFQFMEILKVDLNDKHGVQELELNGTKFLPSLEGKNWSGNDSNTISPQIKLFFKRSRLDVKIIKYTSDVDSQYELFQRLNTGGSSLTPQEIRNSLMIMENKQFFEWFEELGSYQHYINCLPLSNKQKDEKEDMEYLLRFFIYKNLQIDGSIKGNEDIAPFLTEKMHELIKDLNFDYNFEKRVFENVFLFLDQALGEDSFKRYDSDKVRFKGALSIAQFEVIIPGLAKAVIRKPFDITQLERTAQLGKMIKDLSEDTRFNEKKKQYRPILRMRELVAYSEEYFNEL
ncbi:DUF262 domain-containing protein [Bacillus wiedmannii]|uniref:DUF262 domain-containing protein n=1 Tax=Bacillus wiedmannii TaxID=1890302 RepID=UPI00159BC57C|nr:DUF262 domain-containing protein [Bacillus wiedmannii]MED3316511.1 DUF262 domain-containing protein [Bacillus wiedmannii]